MGPAAVSTAYLRVACEELDQRPVGLVFKNFASLAAGAPRDRGGTRVESNDLGAANGCTQ